MAKAINAEFSDDDDEEDDNKSNWDDEEKVISPFSVSHVIKIQRYTLGDVNIALNTSLTIFNHFFLSSNIKLSSDVLRWILTND